MGHQSPERALHAQTLHAQALGGRSKHHVKNNIKILEYSSVGISSKNYVTVALGVFNCLIRAQ
jgi:uncharacterized protein YjhX (UPF0386 family)